MLSSFPSALKKSLIFLITITFIFCGDPIPVEEMGNAKFEIARAESVNAEKYAPEPYKEAKQALFEAHNLISDKKIKEAKEKAEEAQTLAKKAFNIAAPLLAKETRAEAEEVIAQAEKAYAEEFAPEEFNNAVNYFAKGDEEMNAEGYFEAFQAFESSREEAIKARNMAEAQAEVLAREITTIEEMITDAEKYGARESSPDMLSNAEARLAQARESLKELYLKDAFLAIEEARENVSQARDSAKRDWAARKKIEATGKVESAESELVQLKEKLEDPGYKKAFLNSDEAQNSLKTIEETLTAAQESLSRAGDLLDENSFEESYSESEEAIRLASISQDNIPHLMVLMSSLTTKASNIGPDPDSTTSTTTSTTTTQEGGDTRPALGEGWKTYSVRLIPERRDCLWRIAEYEYIYGNPFLWPRIYKANKNQIKNPDLIYPGQVFDIPPETGSLVKPAKTPVSKPKKEEANTPTEDKSNATNPADNN